MSEGAGGGVEQSIATKILAGLATLEQRISALEPGGRDATSPSADTERPAKRVKRSVIDEATQREIQERHLQIQAQAEELPPQDRKTLRDELRTQQLLSAITDLTNQAPEATKERLCESLEAIRALSTEGEDTSKKRVGLLFIAARSGAACAEFIRNDKGSLVPADLVDAERLWRKLQSSLKATGKGNGPICWTCGKKGHQKVDCPQEKKKK
jgi:hypothetical protein